MVAYVCHPNYSGKPKIEAGLDKDPISKIMKAKKGWRHGSNTCLASTKP
jgi:hypothetical protein